MFVGIIRIWDVKTWSKGLIVTEIATFAILPIYGFLAIYAVFWTWEHPIVAPLYDAIARYVHETVENNKKASFSGLKQYFFGNPDVRMLLNLLKESKGLASALRVLALFDENFYEDLKVPDIYFPNLPPKIEKRVFSYFDCVNIVTSLPKCLLRKNGKSSISFLKN